MRIQSITPFKLNNFTQKNNQNSKPNYVQNNVYNPIAYNDLTFTARLCRTPEEFYSEPCNKNYMPETMKQYLNADFDDRKNMPPEQMLALVFDDINETKSLEQVRRIFPDEPLFKNLKDAPNKKSRVGVLAEIDLMKEEGKTLFKNGKDNLGHYILKKIYLEGKTLEEINADFKKDISVHYAGLSPITYQDTSAFGIKFPDRHFWSSFVPHRRRFEPIKPRKPIERRNSSPKTKTDSTPKSAPKQKNRFSGVKDWEIDKFTDALIKGNGSSEETKKLLRKSSVRDDASLGFVAKYMSEINSVVLEKLHISPEMSEFFENYDGLSKSQKQRLDDYWKNTDTRELRSTIMKDVIKLFFEAYGVDGQNDEFKELIEYAHSIKPQRLAQQQEHNRIQAEYDEMFAKLDEEEKFDDDIEVGEFQNVDDILDRMQKFVDKIKASEDVSTYRFVNENGDEVCFIANPKEAMLESITNDLAVMPKAFINKFTKFLSTKDLPDSYMISRAILSKGFKIPDNNELFMPKTEVEGLSEKLNDEFFNENKADCHALQQALVEITKDQLNQEQSSYVAFLSANPLLFIDILNNASRNFLINFDMSSINSKYQEYKRPLSSSEVYRINNVILKLWKNSNYKNNMFIGKSVNGDISRFLSDIARSIKADEKYVIDSTKKLLNFYIPVYGGSLRSLLDKNISEDMARAKFEAFFIELYKQHTNTLYNLDVLSNIDN